MIRSHAEFALGEFAAFEFAREASGIPHETAFALVGTSNGALDGGAFVWADLTAYGQATSEFDGVTVKWASADISGQAADRFDVQQVRYTTFSAAGVSADQFASGLVSLQVWQASGTSSAHFDLLSEAGFDIRCVGSVVLFSSAIATVEATIPGSSSDAFHGVTVTEAVLGATSNAEFAAAGQSVHQATLSSAGISTQRFVAQPWAQASATLGGTSQVDYRGQAKANTRCAITGISDSILYIQPVRVLGFDIRGTGQSAMLGQAVMNSRCALVGTSWAQWLRGRNVFPWLEPAAESTLRPEELRRSERPEELRLVQRPEESRATERAAS